MAAPAEQSGKNLAVRGIGNRITRWKTKFPMCCHSTDKQPTAPKGGWNPSLAMGLLLMAGVLGLGLFALSSIVLRSAVRESALTAARNNARLGLVLALGELQRNPHQDVIPDDTAYSVRWQRGLVSSVESDRVDANEAVPLFDERKDGFALSAAKVALRESGAGMGGAYAWSVVTPVGHPVKRDLHEGLRTMISTEITQPIHHQATDVPARFAIRSYGEARVPGRDVVVGAWCEACVERSRGYVDPSDPPDAVPDKLSTLNQTFGRRFQVNAFRFLTEDEIPS